MEERIRRSEQRLTSLEGWRKDRVDPELDEIGPTLDRLKEFMTAQIASQKTTAETVKTNHDSNKLRLNLALVILTFISVVLMYAEFVRH